MFVKVTLRIELASFYMAHWVEYTRYDLKISTWLDTYITPCLVTTLGIMFTRMCLCHQAA